MSLNIKYCKMCGKPFNYKVSLYCSACMKEIDLAFEKCRDYLEKNEFVTIKELAEKVGLSEKMVLLLLKEDRLSLENSDVLSCEECGKPINSGRYCLKCLVRRHNEFSEATAAYRQEFNPNKSKMSGNEKMYIAQIKKQQEEKRRNK